MLEKLFSHKNTLHIINANDLINAPIKERIRKNIINDKFIPTTTNGHHCSLEERQYIYVREFNNSKTCMSTTNSQHQRTK